MQAYDTDCRCCYCEVSISRCKATITAALGCNSFASSHSGKAPYQTIEVAYGTQVLWPDHCVQGTSGAAFREDLAVPHAELVLRKGYHR